MQPVGFRLTYLYYVDVLIRILKVCRLISKVESKVESEVESKVESKVESEIFAGSDFHRNSNRFRPAHQFFGGAVLNPIGRP